MASPRQIAANGRNADHSTGPSQERGRRARKNAYRDGLSRCGVVVPDAEAAAIEERHRVWGASMAPADPFQQWVLRHVLVPESLRYERCSQQERELLGEMAQNARDDRAWDNDRRTAIDDLAANLADDPGVVSHKLRTSRHGAGWVLEK